MSVPVDVKPLGELLAEGFSKSSLRRTFSHFTCRRDEDVSYFLKAHALQNEETGASRTYLVLDSDALDASKLTLVAFFTLAITVTDYSKVSHERRKNLLGSVPGVNTSCYFPGYLVAQLARDDRYTHEDFDASRLLPLAEDLMRSSVRTVGGRLAYIDCKDELVDYYGRQSYEELYYDDSKGLHKLVKSLICS